MANRVCIGKDNTSPDWYGMKIGKPGINVLGTNVTNNLLWSTDFPKSFNILLAGTWSLPNGTPSLTINFPGAPLPKAPMVAISTGGTGGWHSVHGEPSYLFFDNGDEYSTYVTFWASYNLSNLTITKVNNDYFNSLSSNLSGEFFVVR